MTMVDSTQPTAALGRSSGTTFINVVRSEWTKFWSVRSTIWTLAIGAAVIVGLAVLFAWGTNVSWDQRAPQDQSDFDAVFNSLFPILFGQIAFAVLGVLVVTAEYSTGGVRNTFVVVPNRLKVLAAKGVVIAAVNFVVAAVVVGASFFLCQLFFVANNVEAHLGDRHVLERLLGAVLYMVGVAMFGFAMGAVLRHSAGAITTATALLLVVPLLSYLIPGSIGRTISKYFTMNAGFFSLSTTSGDSSFLTQWTGYGVFTVEWVLLLLVGAFLIQRRDA